MNVLITGATGYIGGRLVQHLSDNSSHQLYAVSRNIPKEMIEMFPDVHFCNIDLLKSGSTLTDLCNKVDCIIHLAAANEIQSKDDPVLACDMNVTASVRLLEIAKKARVKRFLYLSTAHVYGSPLVGTLNEKSPCNPTHPYAITHKVVEDFVLASHEEKKIEGIVLRLSNSFGAPLVPSVNRWSLLLNDLARCAVQGRSIVLKSSGQQYRDFITLTDVNRSILHFTQMPSSLLNNGLFNLGGEYSVPIISMVELLVKRCEKILNIFPEIRIKNQVKSMIPLDALDYKIDKLKKTGFELASSIKEEIDNLLIFCNHNFNKEKVSESNS